MSFRAEDVFKVPAHVPDARLSCLVETIGAVGVEVGDLEPPVVIENVAIPGDLDRTEACFYEALNARIAESDSLTPVPAQVILGESQITGFPLVAFTREATALHDVRFRVAVERNPVIRASKVANRALLACRIDAPPQSSAVSKAIAVVNTEHGGDVEATSAPLSRNWRTRLGAIDFISSGQLLVSELEQTPLVHYTLIGSSHVALQEEHEPGEPKVQWLLNSPSLVRDIASAIPDLIRQDSFIEPLEVYTAFDAIFDESTVNEVRNAIAAGGPAPLEARSDVRTVLVGVGILDAATHQPVEEAASAWLDEVSST